MNLQGANNILSKCGDLYKIDESQIVLHTTQFKKEEIQTAFSGKGDQQSVFLWIIAKDFSKDDLLDIKKFYTTHEAEIIKLQPLEHGVSYVNY